MGRGDKRTFRGKLWRGSHGKTRPKKKALRKVVPAKPVVAEAAAE